MHREYNTWIPFLAFHLEDTWNWKSPYVQMGLAELARKGNFEKEIPVSQLHCFQSIAAAYNQKPAVRNAGNKNDLALLLSEFNLEPKTNLLNLSLK